MADHHKQENITVTFSNKTVLRVVLFVAVGFLVINFISLLSSALQLIFVAFFLALALNPAVSWISKRLPGRSRVGATAIAYLFVVTLLISFVLLIVPPLFRQTVDFVQDIPISVSDIQNQNTQIVVFIRDHNLTDQYTDFVGDVKDNLEGVTARAVSTATLVGSGLIAVITVFVMTFMMLVEGPRWIDRLVELQPKDKVAKRTKVVMDMYTMVTGYVNGQLFIAAVAAFFALVALLIASTIFDVSINAVALALIVGLIGLIPMIGNTIAAVIVVMLCLFVSLPLAVVMAVFFLVYQQVENATFQPFIQSKYNELTPLTVFIAAILGVSVAGFIGALVAIPAAGCLRIYLKEYYGDKFSAPTAKAD